MSGRSNTRWGARQPPRRGGYDDYNYSQQPQQQQQYGASGGYDYDQTQGNSGSRRYSSNRNNYESNANYHYQYNPPPRHAKVNPTENSTTNKSNSSTTNKVVVASAPAKEIETPVVAVAVAVVEEIEPVVTAATPVEENLDQIRQQVTSFFSERADRWKQRHELREQNIQAEKTRLNAEQQQAAMTRLDSSIKRIPPFIRRLRMVTEQQRDALCRDLQTLNLTRYISEVATALTETKLKMSDVWTSVQLCSLLHQRYPDFASSLYENCLKVLTKENLNENSSKFRVDLRLFAELITVHVLPSNSSCQILLNIFNLLLNNDKDFTNLAILISFCRFCGEDYADICPAKIKKNLSKLGENFENSTTNNSEFHSNEFKQQIRQMLNEYFQRLATYLVDEHKQMQKQEQLMKRTLENRGEINQEMKEKHDQVTNTFQKLLQNTETLADLLEQTMPELPIEDTSKKANERIGIDFFLPGRSEDDLGGNTLWEDNDTKQFYEDVPDLKLFLPGYACREAATPTTTTTTTDETETLDSAQIEQEIEREALEATGTTEGEGDDDTTLVDIDDPVEEDVGANNIKLMMDVFVNQLPTCINREMIDKAARDFATNLNTKQNRKRLIKALYTVQRTYLHLLPFYSRLIATLNPVMAEIGNEMVRLLKNEFRAHIRRKDQIYIESKIKTVRFIGELVKFNVFPKSEAINCLKTLLADFRHHNIEMCCHLLETCGRFLYRSPDCHRRTEIILEILMRKKSVLNLDNRYTTQIENAYYYCNPPETKEIEKKIRSPIQEFLRKLLFKDLNKINIEKILRQIRKFNWFDVDFRSYAIKCLTAPYSVKFNSIQCLASILSGLAHFYDDVAIEVLDNVLDDIRSGLEINIPKFNQRRLCMIKYLGEMYNYRVVDSLIIFRTLYLLITFGVNFEATEPNEFDPPEHLFRIRLVYTLLDTCGQYFDRGTSKKRLDCFLLYFQRYFFYKKEQTVWNPLSYPFPLEIQHIFDECVTELRPKFNRADSFAKACEFVDQMQKEYLNQIAEQQAKVAAKNSSRDVNLAPITEDDEQTASLVTDHGPEGLQTAQDDDEDDDDRRETRHEDDDEGEEAEDDDEEFDDDEQTNSSRVRRSRPSGGSGGDEEFADTDGNDTAGVDDDNEENSPVERKKTVSEDDLQFMKAFDAMVAESVAQRSSDMTKIPAPDIHIPGHLRKTKSNAPTTLLVNPSNNDGDDEIEPTTEKKPDTINFVVMMKKNNKPQFFDMAVSSNSEMALKLKAREQADREEKARLKILTLNMSTRMEQQENEQEMLSSSGNRGASAPTLNLNREKRPKYVPPKGAPDADLIFGSKKR